MSLYVFALVDRPPSGRRGVGLSGPLSIRRIGEAFAVVERRADVPPAEFGTLQRHQAVVTDLASRVPAILPVRFGSLLDPEALDEALVEREDDLTEAFERVRNRVQFSWRGSGGPKGSKGSRGSRGSRGSVLSGADYLRQAAKAAKPSPPPEWRGLRRALARFVVAERYQPSQPAMPESLYHLVAREAARQYQDAAAALPGGPGAPRLTGPFAPFAFAPEIL